MGYKKADLNFQIPGVNHFVWMNEAKLKGEDFFSILDKWIRENSETYWKSCGISDPLGKKRMDFYKKHKVVGIGDTLSWTGACWPWWYHSDEEVEKEFGEFTPITGWNSYFDDVSKNARDIIELSKGKNRSVVEYIPNIDSDELMIPLIEALACDIPRVLIVNTLNRGQLVPGIPDDFAVEVPAHCSAGGIHPIQTTPLPKHMIAHILRDRVSTVEMELEAFNTGDMAFLEELVMMDKWASSLRQVRDFIKEILDLHYHKEMKAYFNK